MYLKNLDKLVNVRVSQNLFDYLRFMAISYGTNISGYIRLICNEDMAEWKDNMMLREDIPSENK